MIVAHQLQVQADFDFFIGSETMSTTTESCFDNPGGGNRDKTLADKNMKKLRSIKLSRIPSTRKARSSSSSQYRAKLSGYAAGSEQSTPIVMSDTSPNRKNAANSENIQVLPETLTTESGFKLHRSVSRKSSMRFRRPQMKKSFGGTELKKRVKKSSWREVNSLDDQSSSTPYLKETSSSDMKEQLQVSSCSSGSSFDISDQDKNISEKRNQLVYPCNRSVRAVRTSTLGPMKDLN
ncbi:uncharacterized protein LOC120148123 [Hibiscus syriacus]|uniref:uncharacterized protein LOC120148123 n=1 Tax=Hibiscus syriacus TaxID=106335 RepID=UPI0019207BDA|nr:uncharacterized protein LOC120148123 [Hibiscus syriacus]